MYGHLPYTPAEWALRARAHADAARFRDASHVLEVAAHTPGIPFPSIGRNEAAFFYVGLPAAEARQERADAETLFRCALLVTFEERRTKAGSTVHSILTAELPSGFRINLVALASQVGAAPVMAEAGAR